MTASYTYDGDTLLTVRRGTVELTQCAETGQVGNGQISINDTPGTLDIIGQKDFASDESACADPITFRGFVGDRTIRRGPATAGTQRDIEMTFQDLNAMLGFRRLRETDGLTAALAGNRPSETVAQRAAWLMASPFVSGLFIDNGRCSFPSDRTMDKADYRNQFPGDVLSDMALAS